MLPSIAAQRLAIKAVQCRAISSSAVTCHQQQCSTLPQAAVKHLAMSSNAVRHHMSQEAQQQQQTDLTARGTRRERGGTGEGGGGREGEAGRGGEDGTTASSRLT